MARHHQHIRKRIHQNYEPFPHPDLWKRRLDDVVYVFSFLIPIMTIPQVYKIWMHQTAAGVSLATWGIYWIGAFFWMIYGFSHKEQPIWFQNLFLFLLNSMVVTGVLVYG